MATDEKVLDKDDAITVDKSPAIKNNHTDIITGTAVNHLIQDGSLTVHMNNGDQELPSNGVGDVARPMLEPRKAEKRLLTDSSEGLPARKKRKKSVSAQSQPKNAVCALNELRPGLAYTTVDQSGPVHAPTFTVSVEMFILKPPHYCPQVNGQTYTGQGRSKKLAKHAAAEAALRSFVQFKNAPEAQQAMNVHIADMDFTSDVTETEEDLFHAFQPSSDLVGTKIGDGQVKQVQCLEEMWQFSKNLFALYEVILLHLEEGTGKVAQTAIKKSTAAVLKLWNVQLFLVVCREKPNKLNS
uniref:DRBM domain-containing protein n=1 Tax=Timema cristinae TaxID=61476 RepID=A0A7R9CYK2_TIMCR|nr:unnamed protein product [Timema cristinae]